MISSEEFKERTQSPDKEYFFKRGSQRRPTESRKSYFLNVKKDSKRKKKSLSPQRGFRDPINNEALSRQSDFDSSSYMDEASGSQAHFPKLQHISSQPVEDTKSPIFMKQKMLIVCKVELDAEIKENKPLYVQGLDIVQDLKLQVLGPRDIKVLH